MENAKLKITPPEVLTVSRQDVQSLLDGGDGDAALVYLHILQSGGELDAGRAAAELRRDRRNIEAAALRLTRMGLLTPAPAGKKPAPARELPEYRAQDIVRRSMEDKEFQRLVEAVQILLGHILSSADLKKLFGIYDELALPADVILMLVQYCKEEYQSRYGAEKSVSFKFITDEAYVWFEKEIMTYEQAEQWFREREQRKSLMGQIQRCIGIRDRTLSATERKYIESWIELGFGAEAISIAADRTVTNTGGLKWKYTDSIIQSWHRMGLHTPAEIEKGDKKPSKAAKPAAAPATAVPTQDDVKMLEQLDRLRAKMKQG